MTWGVGTRFRKIRGWVVRAVCVGAARRFHFPRSSRPNGVCTQTVQYRVRGIMQSAPPPRAKVFAAIVLAAGSLLAADITLAAAPKISGTPTTQTFVGTA